MILDDFPEIGGLLLLAMVVWVLWAAVRAMSDAQ